MIISLALNAVVNVTTALGAGGIALLALLLPIVTVRIVNLSFFLALSGASVGDRIKFHVIFAPGAVSGAARALSTTGVAILANGALLN